jgi:hypothetical protein
MYGWSLILILKRKSKIRMCGNLAERKITALYRSFAIAAFPMLRIIAFL